MKLKPKQAVFTLLVCAILAAAISLLLSRYGLSVSRYALASAKLSAPVRIVQLSDLHNSVFGAHNKRLTKKVAAQEPDLILITGDLLNQNERRTDIAAELIAELAAVAPVYVSFGNHEIAYEKEYETDLRAVYTDAGAEVLEFDRRDIRVKGQALRIGGLYGYCVPPQDDMRGMPWEKEWAFLRDFEQTDAFSVLLCHMPVSWIAYGTLGKWDIDCVLCGHAHGGQVRFPFIGGLWAPDQGWFPGRESGLYYAPEGEQTALLSRGLGNTDKLPRFNNIPEIVVLDLMPG